MTSTLFGDAFLAWATWLVALSNHRLERNESPCNSLAEVMRRLDRHTERTKSLPCEDAIHALLTAAAQLLELPDAVRLQAAAAAAPAGGRSAAPVLLTSLQMQMQSAAGRIVQLTHLLLCKATLVPALRDTVDKFTTCDTATKLAREKLRAWLPVATIVVRAVPFCAVVSPGGAVGMQVAEPPQPAAVLERASDALLVLAEGPGSLQAVLSLERAAAHCAAMVMNATGFLFLKTANDKVRAQNFAEKEKEQREHEKKLREEHEEKERKREKEQREKEKKEREDQEKEEQQRKGKGKEMDSEEAKASKKEKKEQEQKEREKREKEEQERRERDQEKREQRERERKEEQQKRDKGKGKEASEKLGDFPFMRALPEPSAEWRVAFGELVLTALPDLLCVLGSEMAALIASLPPPPGVQEAAWEGQQSAVHSAYIQPGYTSEKIDAVLDNMHVCDQNLTAVLQACVVFASETLLFMPHHHSRSQGLEFPTDEGPVKRLESGRKMALAETQLKLISRAIDALWRMGMLKGTAGTYLWCPEITRVMAHVPMQLLEARRGANVWQFDDLLPVLASASGVARLFMSDELRKAALLSEGWVLNEDSDSDDDNASHGRGINMQAFTAEGLAKAATGHNTFLSWVKDGSGKVMRAKATTLMLECASGTALGARWCEKRTADWIGKLEGHDSGVHFAIKETGALLRALASLGASARELLLPPWELPATARVGVAARAWGVSRACAVQVLPPLCARALEIFQGTVVVLDQYARLLPSEARRLQLGGPMPVVTTHIAKAHCRYAVTAITSVISTLLIALRPGLSGGTGRAGMGSASEEERSWEARLLISCSGWALLSSAASVLESIRRLGMGCAPGADARARRAAVTHVFMLVRAMAEAVPVPTRVTEAIFPLLREDAAAHSSECGAVATSGWWAVSALASGGWLASLASLVHDEDTYVPEALPGSWAGAPGSTPSAGSGSGPTASGSGSGGGSRGIPGGQSDRWEGIGGFESPSSCLALAIGRGGGGRTGGLGSGGRLAWQRAGAAAGPSSSPAPPGGGADPGAGLPPLGPAALLLAPALLALQARLLPMAEALVSGTLGGDAASEAALKEITEAAETVSSACVGVARELAKAFRAPLDAAGSPLSKAELQRRMAGAPAGTSSGGGPAARKQAASPFFGRARRAGSEEPADTQASSEPEPLPWGGADIAAMEQGCVSAARECGALARLLAAAMAKARGSVYWKLEVAASASASGIEDQRGEAWWPGWLDEPLERRAEAASMPLWRKLHGPIQCRDSEAATCDHLAGLRDRAALDGRGRCGRGLLLATAPGRALGLLLGDTDRIVVCFNPACDTQLPANMAGTDDMPGRDQLPANTAGTDDMPGRDQLPANTAGTDDMPGRDQLPANTAGTDDMPGRDQLPANTAGTDDIPGRDQLPANTAGTDDMPGRDQVVHRLRRDVVVRKCLGCRRVRF
ncbi:hypothetical protein FOA52_014640 [Chlamydomonas sp. UWO 241]|nr:hypothetical protein FOA52_014640 [Chlamydomonas sp. UWO 241]